jgi:hypothetical protein
LGSIPLSWSARDDRLLHFVHYNVWRKINADSYRKITEVTATNYTDTPTINGTYSYYITTDYTEGESGASNIITFTYPPAGTAPNPVTLVSPTAGATGISLLPTLSWTSNDARAIQKAGVSKTNDPDASRVQITFDPRNPATVYYVYCDTSADPTTLVGSPTTSPFTLTTSLTYSTTYNWKVVAHNSYGNSVGNTIRSFTTMANPTPPNPVTLVSPAAGATGVSTLPSLSWTPAGSGTAPTVFYVYCDTSADPTTLVGSPTTSPFTLTTPLAYSTSYKWKVVAHNANGNSVGNVIRSFTTLADTTPLPTPSNVATAKTQNGIEISWGAITGATVYRIYAVTDPSVSDWGTAIATVTAPNTTWIDTSGSPWRFYRVTADNARDISAKETPKATRH